MSVTSNNKNIIYYSRSVIKPEKSKHHSYVKLDNKNCNGSFEQGRAIGMLREVQFVFMLFLLKTKY
jgi:hypothetical protein